MPDENIPSYADLKAGVIGGDILEAINKSGYPFQAEVADLVRSGLSEIAGSRIQEEWPYIDSESGTARTLDIFAQAPLWSSAEERHDTPRVKPYLNILIECKQSDLPYILFLRTNPTGDEFCFPEISGVKSTSLRIYMEEWQTDSDSALYGASMHMSLHDVFGSNNLETFEGPLFQAVSLAKTTRRGGQGGRLEISGEETYKGLTLPLLKAVDYLKEQTAPKPEAKVLFPRFIVSVAVIRAPLIGAYLHKGRTMMLAIPWVRVSRVEPSINEHDSSNVRYFDIISSDHFAEYLRSLVNDAQELSERMRRHDEVVYSGAGLLRENNDDPEPEPYEVLETIPKEYEQFPEKLIIGSIRKAPRSVEFDLFPEFLESLAEDSILQIDWQPNADDASRQAASTESQVTGGET